MKKAFTLVEMAIVLLVIGVLMAATMKFWSNRIVDLKAQSIKENFVGRYNDIYSQNIVSSFRNGKQYKKLTLVLAQQPLYIVDDLTFTDKQLTDFQLQDISLDSASSVDFTNLIFTPYKLGCEMTDGRTTWDIVRFTFFVPENGKQYCFEIKSETCKLIEQHCKN